MQDTLWVVEQSNNLWPVDEFTLTTLCLSEAEARAYAAEQIDKGFRYVDIIVFRADR